MFLPSLKLRVLLPEIAKRKFLKASLFSLRSLSISFSVLFLYSDILLTTFRNLALIKLKLNFWYSLRFVIVRYLTSRLTTLVFTGSFVPAFLRASLAVASSTPSISNIILPGLITASYPAKSPFPLPIFTSAGF